MLYKCPQAHALTSFVSPQKAAQGNGNGEKRWRKIEIAHDAKQKRCGQLKFRNHLLSSGQKRANKNEQHENTNMQAHCPIAALAILSRRCHLVTGAGQ